MLKLELTENEVVRLTFLYEKSPKNRVRQRAHGLLLLGRGYHRKEVSKLLRKKADTISDWYWRYSENRDWDLIDDPGRGRKPLLDEEVKKIVDQVEATAPRSLKQVFDWFSVEYEKVKVSLSILGRCLKKEGFVYKRMRKSCIHKRDEELFGFFKNELYQLHKLEEKGELDVFYFDETGISLSPVVLYGWQKKGETHRLSSLPSQNQTVVGFMNKACKFYGFRFQGAANSETTIKCLDDFSNEIKKKTVVVLDNASIHKSKKVMNCIPRWKQKGLFLQFIPAYSPELNLIERLWQELKYRWLNKPGYFSTCEELKNALDLVITKIGKEYTINFA